MLEFPPSVACYGLLYFFVAISDQQVACQCAQAFAANDSLSGGRQTKFLYYFGAGSLAEGQGGLTGQGTIRCVSIAVG
jgi:hypothetical protein